MRGALGGMAAPAPSAIPAPRQARLTWLDGSKGISILWIVFFHFFNAYTNGRYPSPIRPHYFATFLRSCLASPHASSAACDAKSIFVALVEIGFHAVAVFIVASGFGLTYSLAKTGDPENGWRGWYRARVVRLFPMYWAAHIVYLLAPFQSRPEPIDYRFALSFLGDRIYPVDLIFYYANPAWWYFGLLLELYLIFPILFRLLQKVGPAWFLVLCGAETVISRFLFLAVFSANGFYVLGAFCGCRLWEFAFGMVIGLEVRRDRARVERAILSTPGLLAGLAIYTLGLYSYGSLLEYTVTDALTGTGLFIILANVVRFSESLPRSGELLAYLGAYTYGLYLVHQPFVIYLGIRMRSMSMLSFTVLAIALIVPITFAAIQLESFVDRITDRVLGRPPKRVQRLAAS
jgi:peptidoglycan/LPS O-acetylase OafA/YrhL